MSVQAALPSLRLCIHKAILVWSVINILSISFIQLVLSLWLAGLLLFVFFRQDMSFRTFPSLINLKLLVAAESNGYIGLPALLEACPFLHRLELHEYIFLT